MILVVNVIAGRFLDAGKSYSGSVLPLLLGIAFIALVASALQMRLLCAMRRRAGEAADEDEGWQQQGPSAQYPALLGAPRPATVETSGSSGHGDEESG